MAATAVTNCGSVSLYGNLDQVDGKVSGVWGGGNSLFS